MTDTGTVNITVDLTPPEISITGVAEGEIYSSAVSPGISVVDNNGEVSTDIILKRLGDPIALSSEQQIGDYGKYVLTVNAVDRAGNAAVKMISFTLATAGAPVINIDKERYSTGETMLVTVNDFNQIGKGAIQVIAYGVAGNPAIVCQETEPGCFIGRHTFAKGIVAGKFFVRYEYDSSNNTYVEARGFYSLENNNSGSGSSGIGDTVNTKPTDNSSLPGDIIQEFDGDSIISGASYNTAVYRKDGDQYVYVPSIYENGQHRLMGNDKGEYVLVKLPNLSSGSTWANPAKTWFEQRGIAPKTTGESISANDAAQMTASVSGISPAVSPGTGSNSLTTSQMEQIIDNTLNASPVGKYVERQQVNRWAQERRALSKPLSKDELTVTIYWFLQNANIAK